MGTLVQYTSQKRAPRSNPSSFDCVIRCKRSALLCDFETGSVGLQKKWNIFLCSVFLFLLLFRRCYDGISFIFSREGTSVHILLRSWLQSSFAILCPIFSWTKNKN